jgi:hypothetical protein
MYVLHVKYPVFLSDFNEFGLRIWEVFPNPENNPHLQLHTILTKAAFV